MKSFQNILVPTDFSIPSEHAAHLAGRLALDCQAKLTLVHAAWMPATAYAGYLEGFSWPVNDDDAARKAMDTQLAKLRELYPAANGLLVRGEDWQAILKAATDIQADLIVMGTHGRTGAPRLFMGSVAEKIVRLSTVPVLTVSGKGQLEVRTAALTEAQARGT